MARGSITKRGNSWRIAVELPPDPETGKRRQKFETVHGKRAADGRLIELQSLVDQQLIGASRKMTTSAYLDVWLRDYGSTRAPSTYVRFQALVRNWIKPHLGNVILEKLGPSHVLGLLTVVRDAPRLDGQPGKLSPQSIRHVYTCLHLALECAVRWQILARNVADAIDAPRVPKVDMRTFTVEQAQQYLEAAAAEGTKWEAFFRVALTAGPRSGELKGLRWTDVDLEARTMSIQQSTQRVTGMGRVTKPPKTSTGRRLIDLDADTMATLRRHRAEQAQTRLSMGSLWQDQGLVFPSEVGTPLEDKRIHVVHTRVCERAEVPRLRPYDLRHTCASLMLAGGASPKVVAERLGHSSPAFTLSVYSHVLPTLQRQAADTLGAMLRKAI